jgi:hypothetical protein
MTARVVRTSATSVRAEWDFTVRREPAGYIGDPDVSSPRVEDIPADIRDALLAWLTPEAEKGLDGCWNFQQVSTLGIAVGPESLCRNCGRPYREHV